VPSKCKRGAERVSGAVWAPEEASEGYSGGGGRRAFPPSAISFYLSPSLPLWREFLSHHAFYRPLNINLKAKRFFFEYAHSVLPRAVTTLFGKAVRRFDVAVLVSGF